MLVKALNVGKLEPVPRNANYTAKPGETQVVSDYVKDYILSKSVTIPEDSTNSSDNTDATDETDITE